MRLSRTADLPLAAIAGALLVTIAASSVPVTADASGYRHGHRHGGHYRSSLSLHYGHRFGGHRDRRHGYRHGRRGSRFSLSLYAPLHFSRERYYRSPRVVYRERVPVTVAPAERRLPDMPSFDYEPLDDQDAGQLTRDRRQCERRAWRESRRGPAAGSIRTTRSVREVHSNRARGDPIAPAAGGAALGAVGGAIAGDAGAGAAIGAAVGAASWFLGALAPPPTRYEEVVVEQYVPPPGPDPAALRDALAQCMQARGYSVR